MRRWWRYVSRCAQRTYTAKFCLKQITKRVEKRIIESPALKTSRFRFVRETEASLCLVDQLLPRNEGFVLARINDVMLHPSKRRLTLVKQATECTILVYEGQEVQSQTGISSIRCGRIQHSDD